MINEPAYWKRDIARIAAELQRCTAQRVWREGSYAKFEKLLMLGFYSTRKLIESEWVDRRLRKEPVQTTAFPCRKLRMYRGTYYHVDEAYDLSRPSLRTPPLEFVCNQVVHSFIFTPAFARKRLTALYCCSYEKCAHVFRFELAELVRVLHKASQSRHHLLLRFATDVNRYEELE